MRAGAPIPPIEPLITPVRLVLYPHTGIHEAIEQLLRKEAFAAPVVREQDGSLLGLLTEKDCLRVLSAGGYDEQFLGSTVARFMSPAPELLSGRMNLVQATQAFLRCNFSSLPVVEEGRLTGRLSRRDLVRAVNKYVLQLRKLAGVEEHADRPRSIEEMQRSAAKQNPSALGRVFSRRR